MVYNDYYKEMSNIPKMDPKMDGSGSSHLGAPCSEPIKIAGIYGCE